MADEPKTNDSKLVWQSKTVWANALIGLSGFYPPAHDWVSSHGFTFSVGVMLLNVALRSISSKKIEWDWKLSD